MAAADPTFAELARFHDANRVSLTKVVVGFLETYLGDRFFRRPAPLEKLPRPRLLNLGCGPTKYHGWCNADIYRFHNYVTDRAYLPDWMLDCTRPWNCPDNAWDGIYTEHTLEHCTYGGVAVALREAYRTLGPGRWLRVLVPDIGKYVHYYLGGNSDARWAQHGHRAMAVHTVTQGFGHVSTWDADLIMRAMREAGFVDVQECQFRQGNDPRLLMDSESRKWESLFVEGRK